MADVTERDEILTCIRTASHVMFDMMQFEQSGIRAIPFVVRPSARLAGIAISSKHFPPHGIGNCPVVLGTLPIRFKDIDSNSQVGPSIRARRNRPAKFGPQFADAPRPFGMALGDVTEFFVRDGLPHVQAEKFQDLLTDSAVFFSNRVSYIPAMSRIPILFGAEKNIVVGPHRDERGREISSAHFPNGHSAGDGPSELDPELTQSSGILLDAGDHQQLISLNNDPGIFAKIVKDPVSCGRGIFRRDERFSQVPQCLEDRNQGKNLRT